MKRLLLIIICCLIMFSGCTNNSNNDDLKNKKTNNDTAQNKENKEIDKNMSNLKITINDKSYTMILENNKTVEEFINLLPQEFTMSELNGNEKYVYMDNSLTTNSYKPNHIEKGDVMLYGDNCLVIFYKSFDTSYSYTKIGHINNLEDLGNRSINVTFEK